MSEVVDQRVVQMRFDNSNFEKNVSDTMGSLDKLNKKLDFTDASKSFDSLTKAAENVDLSGISSSLDYLQNRFSAFGIASMTVISNLTTKAMDLVSTLGSKIYSGGLSRSLNIESAKFQLEGLGVAYNDVADAINYAVTDTAYGLDAAAQAAAQLASSGLNYTDKVMTHTDASGNAKELDNMAIALKAISGVAAQTESDYATVARYFQDIANAGAVSGSALTYMTQVLNLPVKNNLAEGLNAINDGSMEASESVKETVKKITNGTKVTSEDIADMCKDGLIDFDTFSTIMFDKYADHASDANKTLNGVISNIGAALSKIGEIFIHPMVQNEGPIVNFLDAIRLKLNQTKDNLIPLAAVIMPKIASVLNKITDFINGMDWSVTKDADGNVTKIADAFTGFYKTLQELKPVLDFVKNAAQMLVIPLKTIFSMISTGRNYVDVFGGIGDFFTNLNESAEKSQIFVKIGTTIAHVIRQLIWGITDIIDALVEFAYGCDGSVVSLSAISDLLSIIVRIIFERFGKIIDTIFGTNLSEWFSNLGKSISDFVNKLDFSKVDEFFKSLTSGIDGSKLLSGVGSVFDFLGSAIEWAWGIVSTVGGKIIDWLSQLFGDGSAFKDATILTLLSTFAYNIKKALVQVNKLTGWFGNKTKGIKTVKDTLDQLRDTLAGWEESLKATYFLKIGAALLMLAFSIAILANIDSDKLGYATAAVTTMIAELAGSLKLLQSGRFSITIGDAGTMLLKMAASVYILALSMKNLSDLNPTSLLGSFLAVSALLWELTAIVSILSSDKTTDMAKGVSGLISMAIAVRILASSVTTLASIEDPNRFDASLEGVMILVAELTAVVWALSYLKVDSLAKGLTGLIAMALAVRILVESVKPLSEMNSDVMWQGLAGVTTLIVLLGGLASVMGKVKSEKMLSIGASMVLVCAGVAILAKSVSALGNMELGQLVAGMVAMIVLVDLLGALMLVLDGMESKGGNMLGISTSILIIAAAIGVLALSVIAIGYATTQFGGIFEGLAVIIALGFALYEFCANVKVSDLLGVSAALAIFAASLVVISAALIVLGNLPLGVIVQGLGAIAAVMLILYGASAFLGGSVIFILEFSAALLVFGLAATAVGVGLIAIGTGLTLLAAGCTAVVASLPAMITAIVVGVGAIITSLLNVIIDNMPLIAEAVIAIVKACCSALVVSIPTLVQTVLVIILAVLTLLDEYVPQIVEKFCSILIGFINAIIEYVPELTEAFMNLIVTCIQSMADSLEAHEEDLSNALHDLMQAGLDFLFDFLGIDKEEGNKFFDMAINCITGFVNGVLSLTNWLADQLCSFFEGGLEAVKDFLGIASPSKEFAELGKYSGLGYVVGLKNTFSKVKNASEKLGDSALEGIQNSNAMSSMYDVFGDEVMSPTITPVLDTSGVQNGLSAISGMFAENDNSLTASIAYQRSQNRQSTTDDVVSALNSLGTIFGSSGNTNNYNINGITYDDGSNVANAVQTLVRATTMQRRA